MNLTKGLYNHDSAMGTNIHIIYGRHDFFDTLNDFGIVDFFLFTTGGIWCHYIFGTIGLPIVWHNIACIGLFGCCLM